MSFIAASTPEYVGVVFSWSYEVQSPPLHPHRGHTEVRGHGRPRTRPWARRRGLAYAPSTRAMRDEVSLASPCFIREPVLLLRQHVHDERRRGCGGGTGRNRDHPPDAVRSAPPALREEPSLEGGHYRDNRSTRNASERRALRPSRTTASPATRTVSTVRLLAQVSSVAPLGQRCPDGAGAPEPPAADGPSRVIRHDRLGGRPHPQIRAGRIRVTRIVGTHRPGGRPRVRPSWRATQGVDNDMADYARAQGVPVPLIASKFVIPRASTKASTPRSPPPAAYSPKPTATPMSELVGRSRLQDHLIVPLAWHISVTPLPGRPTAGQKTVLESEYEGISQPKTA